MIGVLPDEFKSKLFLIAKLVLDPFIISGFVAAFLAAVFWMIAMTKFDLSHAYPDPTLKGLVRTLTLEPDGTLRLADAYVFARAPRSIEEGFVTFEAVRVEKGGRAVCIGSGPQAVRMASDGAAGRFSVEERRESVAQDHQHRLLRRIVFKPSKLAREMVVLLVVK